MIVIVTDSTAYLTRKEAEELGVHIIPVMYSIGEKKYVEKFSEENDDLLREINSNMSICKTSHPNQYIFSTIFSQILSAGNDILYISMSSRLSGTYSSGCIAANNLNDSRITVFDSLSICGGEKLLVEKAVELQRKGNTIDEIIQELTILRDKIQIVFCCKDMTALRNSGRIGFVRQSIGTMLNILPFLVLKDGTITSVQNVKGINNFISMLIDKMPNTTKKVIINCIDNKEVVERIILSLRNHLNDECLIEINKAGPIVAIHLGLESFGVCWHN